MYQPRRADGPAAESVAQARRASRTWYAATADRIGAIFLGLAVTATAGALAMAGTASAAPAAVPAATTAASAPAASDREQGVSRADVRVQIAVEDVMSAAAATQTATDPVLKPTRTMFAKDKLTVRTAPKAGAKQVASLDAADKLTVTPDVKGKYRKVTFKGDEAWVLKASLSNTKPTIKQVVDANSPAPKRKVASGSVLGLQPEAMVVYRAVMERWAVKSVGGYRATSLSVHQFGRAIDFMTFSNNSQGYAIRDFLVAHAKEFGIDHIIYMQQIWTPYRPTWRHMADRGSATANHLDHVHVAVKDR